MASVAAGQPAAGLDLGVERLEQSYRRLTDSDGGQRFDYAAAAFDFAYPRIAAPRA